MVLPNQLTVLRIILTPVFVYLFLSEEPLLKQISLGVFIIAAITDWYDGWLARKFNYITNWGKFLDPLADKILTSAAFLAFVFLDVLDLWMVLIIIIRDMVITGIRVFAEFQNKSFATSILAKWKTFLQMIFIYYLLVVFTLETVETLYKGNETIFAILMDRDLIYYSMLLITVITFYTGIAYFIRNRNLIKQLFTFENKSN
ncbi:MAG: CDP-diacylglycerol--glycerol-3-phosphate 3-phosphatidyltransferase [Melioribacteraceae bacterium]|nr:CDP-diacylglycerol--glycerol-3-phosphate 3-phosphatidyltransferase [Melioribacteraceae bacterium]MCF8352804.1 CDP-diacylglycerol--glycerol-3-phosphate 3-phosphatidyltransferase [Melioribacteraceae bacterium]MCF8393476.1 CDP-diacylglycerol--glycerol-3-phosphate 3-phosphatidyltransferase [Melioribacteraceae bacterium]MCF8417321.1 CDP-diacylglycerol--glycerol-3-phosphate 3-phosphatidyltransferase [Melioribacteraceae bacterium]